MSDDKNNINFTDMFRRLLNPRSRLDDVPSFSDSMPVGKTAVGEGMDMSAPARPSGRLTSRDIFGNFPLVFGAILILGLFGVVLFGPAIAPQNPYIAGQHILPHYDAEKGEFIRPPLAPSAEYPLGTDEWGTDILSLLLHGARNTLVAAAFITMIRIFIGLTLGAIAGWNEGSTTDQFIMGLIGALTALPLLVSSMIFIYALDIRKGLIVFIIALSLLGWTEIAQYIRSEFMVLRKMPYIEGATATGLNGLQTAVRHILPNVLPQLLVITFLEMGAVLLLLGELAFVGVYIGGGSRVDLTEPMGPTRIFTIAEMPEWGTMLADGFRWLRSKPFVVMPPATAFFIAVLGFNMLGEGLRRLVEKQSINTAFLLKKRMIGVIAVLTFATIFIMNNTGAGPWFAKIAQSFNVDEAMAHTAVLSEMDGRSSGQDGGAEAAAYIAAKFEEYGLEPAWKSDEYAYPVETRLVQPLEQPLFNLLASDGTVTASYLHQRDFGYLIEGHGGNGDVTAPLIYVGFAEQNLRGEAFAGLDLSGKIVLLDRASSPPDFATEAMVRGAAGVLWVTGNGRDDVRSQIQLANPGGDYLRNPNIPIFAIRPAVADDLLAADGLSWEELKVETGDGDWFTRDLQNQAQMQLTLTPPQAVEVPNIMGYLPGSDLDLADELVVIYVAYDGLGVDPDGTIYPATNHNAGGVGLMLELVRLWQEQSLDTRRTTMFVAWGGEQLDDSGTAVWVEDIFNFRHLRSRAINASILPAIFIQLDYVGAGGDTLLIHPDTDDNLADLFVETSTEFEIETAVSADTPEFSTDGYQNSVAVWGSLKWEDDTYDENNPSDPTTDIYDQIDRDKLQRLGQMLSLALTKVARETQY